MSATGLSWFPRQGGDGAREETEEVPTESVMRWSREGRCVYQAHSRTAKREQTVGDNTEHLCPRDGLCGVCGFRSTPSRELDKCHLDIEAMRTTVQ